MSFQAYLDNIKIKTGKTPADFKLLADKKGLLKEGVKAGEMVSWLKKDFDLGHGHAMAIYTALKGLKELKADKAAMLEKHFSRNKSSWKPAFDFLYAEVKNFGNDITLDPAASYISILRSGKKFAIVQVAEQRMDIGIKLKTVLPTKRLNLPGTGM